MAAAVLNTVPYVVAVDMLVPKLVSNTVAVVLDVSLAVAKFVSYAVVVSNTVVVDLLVAVALLVARAVDTKVLYAVDVTGLSQLPKLRIHTQV